MNPLELLIGPVIENVGKILGDLITTDKERLHYDLENRKLDQANEQAQIDVNKEEAKSASLFVAGWRPFFGWVGGAGFAYVVAKPLLSWVAVIYQLPPLPDIDVDTLWVVAGGMLGIGTLRTAEKIKRANEVPANAP